MIRLETLIELEFLALRAYPLLEIIDKEFPVEQFEATVAQSAVPFTPLILAASGSQPGSSRFRLRARLGLGGRFPL